MNTVQMTDEQEAELRSEMMREFDFIDREEGWSNMHPFMIEAVNNARKRMNMIAKKLDAARKFTDRERSIWITDTPTNVMLTTVMRSYK